MRCNAPTILRSAATTSFSVLVSLVLIFFETTKTGAINSKISSTISKARPWALDMFKSEPVMKILKIFGLVVGVHVVAFMFVFAIPGCRSTTRHSPPPAQSVQAEAAAVRMAPPTPAADSIISPYAATNNNSSGANDLMGAPVNATPVSFDAGSVPGVRFNPTRPGSPTAVAVQTAAAPQVTPASTHVVASGETLWKIAKAHQLTTKELAAANKLRPDAPLKQGQKILIPGKAVPSSTASSSPTGVTGDTLVYKVKPGETLQVIARHAGTTSAAIKTLNHLKSDTVRAGQELTLPAGNAAASALAASSTNAETDANAAAAKATPGGVHHVVKTGETLGTIAKHYGITRRELAVANNIADPLKLRAGQDLVIPNPKTGTTPRSQSAPADTAAASNAATATPAASSAPASPGATLSLLHRTRPIRSQPRRPTTLHLP